jgi:hypothetical protein
VKLVTVANAFYLLTLLSLLPACQSEYDRQLSAGKQLLDTSVSFSKESKKDLIKKSELSGNSKLFFQELKQYQLDQINLKNNNNQLITRYP